MVGGLVLLVGLALVALSLWYATYESYEFGRWPYVIIGGISAAAGLALAGSGILVMRDGRRFGSQTLLVLGLILLTMLLVSWGGLLLAPIPLAAALLVVARGFFASRYRGRTA